MKADVQVILSGRGIREGFQIAGEYEIYLEWDGGYQTVRFRIVEAASGYFEFYQSHFLQTPEESAPYRTSGRTAQTQTEALRLGVESIMRNYNLALGKGHRPSAIWFVRNEEF